MVIRILTGKEVAGAVRYNERKVEEGRAERIQIANYPDQTMAEKYAQFRLQLLEQLTRLNPAIAKPSVHIAIAFHPTELIKDDQLRQIGSEVMTEAGYGRQPYLVYRHDDTEHPHIHIVSVSVDANGRKISDKFIRTRMNKIRKDTEQKHGLVRAEQRLPQLKLGKGREGENDQAEIQQLSIDGVVQQALETFSFGSIEGFRQYLLLKNVVLKHTAGRSKMGVTFQAREKSGTLTRPVRASSLVGKPTNKRLAELFASQAERHAKGCETMATVIGQRLSRYESLTESEYKTTLQQVGIQVNEQGGIYLYVQERAGLVAQENELEAGFWRQTLLTRFAENTIRKAMPADNPGLPLTMSVQKPGLQQLPQETTRFTIPNELVAKRNLKKGLETTAHSTREGRGEDEQNVSLIEKPKKSKKNLRRRRPRL